jgi:hypothetical protein
LEENSRRRAAAQADAADRSWRELHGRDGLEAAWERIYVTSPGIGQPVNYRRWTANVLAFADVAKAMGKAELFLSAKPERQNERDALSLIQAALTRRAEAVVERLAELDKDGDAHEWKRVFNQNELFWRTLEPQRLAAEMQEQPDEIAGDFGPGVKTGFLGGTELADALRVHPSRRDAFFVQLQRKRKNLGDDCWIETTERGPNRPAFLYRVDSPQLQKLAAPYVNAKSA